MTIQKLSKAEKALYERHLAIPEIGEKGQLALKASSVIIIGAGGLGSASAMYLAAAGIGRLGIVDSDVVEVSNLQRQVLHGMANLGAPKTASARDRLSDINPNIRIDTHQMRITKDDVMDVLSDYSIVLDATDNFETRYLLNYACVQQHKPFIFASVYHFHGQLSVFDADKGPCFRCVFKEYPSDDVIQSNRGVGVCSPLPGIMGTMQALEAIKLITGAGTTAIGRLLLLDGLDLKIQDIQIKNDPQCPTCGHIRREI